jgi:hypothetical protein
MGMAERVGFEPTVEFPRHSLSRRAPSTARTPLRGCFRIVAERGRRGNGGAFASCGKGADRMIAGFIYCFDRQFRVR